MVSAAPEAYIRAPARAGNLRGLQERAQWSELRIQPRMQRLLTARRQYLNLRMPRGLRRNHDSAARQRESTDDQLSKSAAWLRLLFDFWLFSRNVGEELCFRFLFFLFVEGLFMRRTCRTFWPWLRSRLGSLFLVSSRFGKLGEGADWVGDCFKPQQLRALTILESKWPLVLAGKAAA